MTQACHPSREVDKVTVSLGPLYYGKVTVGGTPIEAIIDTGHLRPSCCSRMSERKRTLLQKNCSRLMLCCKTTIGDRSQLV